MKIQASEIPAVLIIEPDVYRDERGYFMESYNAEKYRAAGIDVGFVQDNHSCSKKGTLRGLHAQCKRPQAKLVRVVQGEVFDVAVDIRHGSPTFGRWVGVSMSAENHRQVFVPEGFAHGFCVLSEVAHVEYKVSDRYDPDDEITLLWNDPALGIEWPVHAPLLSRKDRDGRPLAALLEQLPAGEDGKRESRR